MLTLALLVQDYYLEPRLCLTFQQEKGPFHVFATLQGK